MSLRITTSHWADVAAHCESAYPNEGCGALLGRIESDQYWVTSVTPMRNAGQTRADWFELDPSELLAVEQSARAAKTSVIGFFHSHPDAACRPSQQDLERAWPVYSYLILSVANGRVSDYSSWRLCSSGTEFTVQVVEIVEEGE